MAKEIITGFLVGIAANLIGIFLYITLFSDFGVEQTIKTSIDEGFIGSLIALGAILNFLPFFLFLKKHEYYKARGVLLASLFAAIVIAITKVI
ncbi:MAG TPA: hypothetical protein VFM70_06010 [Salinimicrobium sp.]|nr:hypothetical protein [Salinimicrobium sp.]